MLNLLQVYVHMSKKKENIDGLRMAVFAQAAMLYSGGAAAKPTCTMLYKYIPQVPLL